MTVCSCAQRRAPMHHFARRDSTKVCSSLAQGICLQRANNGRRAEATWGSRPPKEMRQMWLATMPSLWPGCGLRQSRLHFQNALPSAGAIIS